MLRSVTCHIHIYIYCMCFSFHSILIFRLCSFSAEFGSLFESYGKYLGKECKLTEFWGHISSVSTTNSSTEPQSFCPLFDGLNVSLVEAEFHHLTKVVICVQHCLLSAPPPPLHYPITTITTQ